MRILIADDHPFVRNGVKNILEAHRGYEVCGEAENGAVAVQKVQELNPDVLVLDITMPVMNGIDAARQILEKRPDMPIVILSMHESGTQLEAARKLGIKGYVSKARAVQDLIRAIDAVSAGKTYFST